MTTESTLPQFSPTNIFRALSKAKAKKDRSLQRELQAEIRNLRKEIRKREVCLNLDEILMFIRAGESGSEYHGEPKCGSLNTRRSKFKTITGSSI